MATSKLVASMQARVAELESKLVAATCRINELDEGLKARIEELRDAQRLAGEWETACRAAKFGCVKLRSERDALAEQLAAGR